MKTAVHDIILPAAIAKREALVRAHLNPCWESTKPPPTQQQVLDEIKRHRIVLTVDGEYQHLKNLVDYFIAHPEDEGIDVIKFSAACSKTQQPADVSPCFRVLKQRVSMSHLHPPETMPLYYQYLQSTALAKIPAASRKTFLDFFKHSKDIIDAAFTPHNIHCGFSVAGLCPLNTPKMMSQCTTFQSLTKKEVDAAIAGAESLVPLVHEHGQLREQDIDALAGGLLKSARERTLSALLTKAKGKTTKVVELRPVNHRRALIVNHARVMQTREALDKNAAVQVWCECVCVGVCVE